MTSQSGELRLPAVSSAFLTPGNFGDGDPHPGREDSLRLAFHVKGRFRRVAVPGCGLMSLASRDRGYFVGLCHYNDPN